jgi:hypothetical protein
MLPVSLSGRIDLCRTEMVCRVTTKACTPCFPVEMCELSELSELSLLLHGFLTFPQLSIYRLTLSAKDSDSGIADQRVEGRPPLGWLLLW